MECKFDGCEKPNFARGYCSGHAAQLRRGDSLTPLRQARPTSPAGFSWCSECKQHRSVDDFPWDVSRDEPARTCRACRATYMRGYNAKNRKRVNRNATLTRWGITEEQYRTLFEEQDHKCAICGVKHRTWRNLSIDHDHKTGRIRGLLCHNCNVGLGQFDDDPKLIQKTIDYLRAGGVIHDPELRAPEDAQWVKEERKRHEARARRREEQSAE